MKVKFLDLQRQYAKIGDEIEKAVLEVLRSGNYVCGKKVQEFEEKWAEFCGVKYCIAVNNGTSALDVAIKTWDLRIGSKILTSPNSFFATYEAIKNNNLASIFKDIDNTGNISFDCNQESVDGFLPVSLYGNPIDYTKINYENDSRPLIGDHCQSHGCKINNIPIDRFVDVGCYSFYAGKNLGACGEGGAIVTNNKDIYDFAKLYRSHGQPIKYYHDISGWNYRMDEVTAAVLLVKLKYLNEWNEKRANVAIRYFKNLSDKRIKFLYYTPFNKSNFHVLPVFVNNRDKIKETLFTNGIETNIHYPIPIHKQKGYGGEEVPLPVTEWQASNELSLPIYPEITNDEIDYVSEKLIKAIDEFGF